MQAEVYKQLNEQHPDLKDQIRDYWNAEPCESRAGKSVKDRVRYFEEIDEYRYRLSPFIFEFAQFEKARGKKVLEIGLGSGSDFIRWAIHGADLHAIDLTPSSVELCKERLQLENLKASVQVGDAENLPFPDNHFDLVYSYGVIHHSPETEKIVKEIRRVLKPGGTAKVMIYNASGLSIWYQWALFSVIKKFRPWESPRKVTYYHNESLGTKLYTRKEAQKLFEEFSSVNIRTIVDCGDTLQFELSERYRDDRLIKTAKRFSSVLKNLQSKIPSRFGTTMLIEATKPR